MEGSETEVLHNEHREWLNKLDFYKADLNALKKPLEEVATKNASYEVMAMVEHFQNQFIIQRNEIDEFRHAIKEHENHIAAANNTQETRFIHQRISDHPELQERMDRFEKLFEELRADLLKFMAKYI